MGLAWRADTRTLWTIDGPSGRVGTVDLTTAAFTHVFTATPASGWEAIDFDPMTGMFWLSNTDRNLYRLDPATAATTRVGATGVPLLSHLSALETDASGTLWGMGFNNGILYRVDKLTGAATPTVTVSPLNMRGLSFGPDGRLFGSSSLTRSLYLINTTTGATTLSGAHGGGVTTPTGLEITYSLASAVPSGAGCPEGRSVSWYEQFAGGTFDLANRAISLTPAGSGYRVAASTSAFVTPVSPLPPLGDDALSAVLALPFTFAYPGGSTTQIRVCSNGFVHLNGAATATGFTPSAVEMLNGGPRLFPLWMDLNPAAPGSGPVFFDVNAAQGRAVVTWRDVPQFGGTNLNTLQVEIHANGTVVYRWLSAGNVGTRSALVGFSPGAASRDPGNRDLTTTMPFTTARDVFTLTQDAARPALRTTIGLQVRDISNGSLAGVELLGVPLPAGIDLTANGMPSCSLYVLPVAVTLPFAITGRTAMMLLTIPGDQSLIGARVGVQAAVLTPGINAAGIVTSNLVTLTVGEF